MGCDIHIVLERRKTTGGKWIGVYLMDDFPGGRPVIARRDYGFFSRVAGVRGHTSETLFPKNIPEDVSELAWQQYMTAPTDHHSASYMPASQFANAWIAENPPGPESKIRAEWAVYDLLGVDATEGDFEYRVVFWFDN
jgi:hypothetical protein